MKKNKQKPYVELKAANLKQICMLRILAYIKKRFLFSHSKILNYMIFFFFSSTPVGDFDLAKIRK